MHSSTPSGRITGKDQFGPGLRILKGIRRWRIVRSRLGPPTSLFRRFRRRRLCFRQLQRYSALHPRYPHLKKQASCLTLPWQGGLRDTCAPHRPSAVSRSTRPGWRDPTRSAPSVARSFFARLSLRQHVPTRARCAGRSVVLDTVKPSARCGEERNRAGCHNTGLSCIEETETGIWVYKGARAPVETETGCVI